MVDKTPPVIVPGSKEIEPGILVDDIIIITQTSITITKTVTDNLSGAIVVRVQIKDESGKVVASGALSVVGGTGASRTMSGTITLPPDLPSGEYTLEQVAVDYAGNPSVPDTEDVSLRTPPPTPPTPPPPEPPGQPPDKPGTPGNPGGKPPVKPEEPITPLYRALIKWCSCGIVSFGIFGGEPIKPALIHTGSTYTTCGLKIGLEIIDGETGKELRDIDDWYVGCIGIHYEEPNYYPCVKKAKTPAKITDQLTIKWGISGWGKIEDNADTRANVYIPELEIGASTTATLTATITDGRGHSGDSGKVVCNIKVTRKDITEYIVSVDWEALVGENSPPTLPKDRSCPCDCCHPTHKWVKDTPIEFVGPTPEDEYIPVDVPVIVKSPLATDLDKLEVKCPGGGLCAGHKGTFSANEIVHYEWTVEPQEAGVFPPHGKSGIGSEEVFVATKPGPIEFTVTADDWPVQGNDPAKTITFTKTAVMVDLDIEKVDFSWDTFRALQCRFYLTCGLSFLINKAWGLVLTRINQTTKHMDFRKMRAGEPSK